MAVEHNLPELAELAEETRRKFHGRRAPIRARAVNEDVAATVKIYADDHPQMPQREIGRIFGIDGGRVSEILFGKRGNVGG